MLRSKNRTRSAHLDDDGPRPGAYEMQGRGAGQIPVWARIRSIRRGRSTRHWAWSSQRVPTSDPVEGPELTEVSSHSPLSLIPIPDTPLDAPRERSGPYEPWRDNVDIPSEMESPTLSTTDQAVRRRSSDSDATRDYSLPPELRQVRRQRSSSSTGSSPRDNSLPDAPSMPYSPPELQPAQPVSRTTTVEIPVHDDELMDSGNAEFVSNGHDRQKERRRNCFLFAGAILIGVITGVMVGVPIRNNQNDDDSANVGSGESNKCSYSSNAIPDPFTQCECEGVVSMWTDDIKTQYSSLRESFMPTILPAFDEAEESCNPTNTALWQLSNDTLYGVNATDNRYLLTLLYANWDGGEWRNKDRNVDDNWLSTTIPECKWYGVECNDEGLTRSISLEANNLGGTIPSELGLMTALREIDLESNRLSGTLPQEMFQLQSLVRVQLGINFLNGTIATEFALLSNLAVLQLDVNNFSGTIPAQLGSMISLQYLGIGDNSLTGTIPLQIGRLLGLEILSLDQNSLTGTLPRQLGRLERLRSFTAGSNFFRGKLISDIGNLINLRCLDLDQAGLAGEIPLSEMGLLSNLSILSLQGNNFVGTLPVQLNNLTNLAYVYLSGNGLSGTIPSEIGTWSSLSVLELDDNFFGGTIPSDLGNLSLLANLNLGGLPLSGTVPQQVCGLRNGALDVFIGPCTDNDGVAPNTFQCSVPDCCTECVTR